MDVSNPEIRDYLVELYNQTEGNMELQVSMHDVGAVLGMDKNQSDALGQDLIVEGLVDLRTLAGGISITAQGIEMLQKGGYVTVSVKDGFQLSGSPVIIEADRQALEKITKAIKQAVSEKSASFEDLEEIIIDLKTLEVHLLSPNPKTTVVRAIFKSLHGAFKRMELNEIALSLSGAFE